MTNLATALMHFTGSETFTRHHLIVATEGVMYLADKAGAFWLLDAISSYMTQPAVRREDFQVWKLVVKEGQAATLTMTDGNTQRAIVTQDIPFTDFPLPKITLYVEYSGGERIAMLPQER